MKHTLITNLRFVRIGDIRLDVSALTVDHFRFSSQPENEARWQLRGFDARPLDITEHENITDVWNVLPAKAAEYWIYPNMPTLQWAPAERIRGAFRASIRGPR